MEPTIKQMSDEITHANLFNEIKLVNADMTNIKDSILRIEKANSDAKDDYVTKTEFGPVRNISYGLVSIILIAVVGAILSGVVVKSNAEAIQTIPISIKHN